MDIDWIVLFKTKNSRNSNQSKGEVSGESERDTESDFDDKRLLPNGREENKCCRDEMVPDTLPDSFMHETHFSESKRGKRREMASENNRIEKTAMKKRMSGRE